MEGYILQWVDKALVKGKPGKQETRQGKALMEGYILQWVDKALVKGKPGKQETRQGKALMEGYILQWVDKALVKGDKWYAAKLLQKKLHLQWFSKGMVDNILDVTKHFTCSVTHSCIAWSVWVASCVVMVTDREVLHKFRQQLAVIERDAIFWLHTTVPRMVQIKAPEFVHW